MRSSSSTGTTVLRVKRSLGHVLVLVITVAVLFAAGEMVMRVLYPMPEFSGRLWRREWNEDYHTSVFIPGTEVIYAGVPMKVNSLGLRNREIEDIKGGDVTRILVFGDSFTFGDGLRTGDTIPSLLEVLLNRDANDARQYEVINFGVPGMNTFQEVMYALNYGLRFDPDGIILVWVYNDIELNGYSLEDFSYFVEHRTVPTAGVGEGGAIPRRETGGDGGGKHGFTVRLWRVYEGVRNQSRFIAFLGARSKELLQRLGVSMKMSEKIIYSDLDSEGFKLSLGTLDFINRELRGRDIEFHAVLYPPLQRLNDDYYDRLIMRKVEDFCVTSGIRYLNLFDSFRGQDPNELHVTKMDYHSNRRANEIASKAVADYLRRASKLF